MKACASVILLCFAFPASICQARVGESNKQLVARFGEPVAKDDRMNFSLVRFEKAGLTIECILKKNACIYERYTKGFLGIEWPLTFRLLNTFSDGKPWNPISAEDWTESDNHIFRPNENLAFGNLRAFADQMGLHIFSFAWETLSAEDVRDLEMDPTENAADVSIATAPKLLRHFYHPRPVVKATPAPKKIPGF